MPEKREWKRLRIYAASLAYSDPEKLFFRNAAWDLPEDFLFARDGFQRIGGGCLSWNSRGGTP